MQNLFDVSGKVVVITGGSRGIGAMMAEGFLRHGARVFITARKQQELQQAIAELSAFGECTAIAADLSTAAGIQTVVSTVGSAMGRVDVLINNAGASWGAPLESYPESGWDKVMNINLKAVFYLTQQLLPLLRAAASDEDPARIINIASINGISYPVMPNYAYSASKAGLIQLTRHLATDLAPDRINVNGIAPGIFATRMMAGVLHDMSDLDGRIPRGRTGQLEDAAGTAIYLSSRASAWMTGHTLVLDGGMVAAAG